MPLMLTLTLSYRTARCALGTHSGCNGRWIKETIVCVEVEQRRGNALIDDTTKLPKSTRARQREPNDLLSLCRT